MDDMFFGRFGGGQFVPETLIEPLKKLERAYKKFKDDPEFNETLEYYLRNWAGRPTPPSTTRRG